MDSEKYRELGEKLKRTVSDAVASQNYDKLGENISNMVNTTLTAAGAGIKQAVKNSFSRNEERDYPINPSALPAGYGMVSLVLGIAGTAVFFTAAFVAFVIGVFKATLFPTAFLACCTAVCCIAAVRGYKSARLKKRFKRYSLLMSRGKHFLLDDIAAAYPLDRKQVSSDLSKLIKIGAFPQGHIDKKYFICDNETYNYYIQSLETERNLMKDPETAKKLSKTQASIERGREYITGIRSANNAIIDKEMSDKLDTTEKLLKNIFDRLEKRPELFSEARRLIEYYLPITQKLLNAYIELNLNEIETENIKKSKQEIEKSIDSINTAFYNLYNDLFLDDKVDIISDISVLNSMFANEGLSNRDFKRKDDLNGN